MPMTPEQLIKAAIYAEKFFRKGFYQSKVTWNAWAEKPYVCLPYPYMTISGHKEPMSEFGFVYDERAKRFYFSSQYVSKAITLTDDQCDEILNFLGQGPEE